ncbi:NADH-quinone oxidoreductase subunit M [candidate division KSB1 bacterium]|nr:NADH-quinone oxidoreductase subunit M [candidate division KSB1 bacterium]
MTDLPLLSITIFLPAIGALLLLFLKDSMEQLQKMLALIVSALTFIVSLPLYFSFNSNTAAFQFEENYTWISAIGANYHVGIDGISLLMIMLTTFLGPLVVLSAWNAVDKSLKGFLISLLVLETGMLGVFASLDIFLFYIFWEAMLIPMYFVIGIWGGQRRVYAAVKFFIYTMVGSLLMMVAILFAYFYVGEQTGTYSFDYIHLRDFLMPVEIQKWLFLAFGLSFAIKVPMFPFHTWLPDAHVEAPTAGSVILAGVLLKMGTYGFLRFCLPMFPNATFIFAPLISILAVIGILYGAWVAMVQKDVKKLVAYSSVSHLGFVMLGIFSFTHQGMQGGLIQMVNHGLSTGALFLIVGMIYERRHTRMIEDFGGLARQIPIFTTFFMIVTLSSIGLPGLNGFVGEFLVLLGTFQTNVTLAVLATSGVIFAAVYMLWMFKRVMFGPITREENKRLTDLSKREVAVLVPIVVFIVWIGVYAQPFLGKMEKSVDSLLAQLKAKQTALVQPGNEIIGGGE